MIVTDILLDGLFAAVAAIGFGAISDPPMRAFPRIALLAAIGHALRFTLIHCAALDSASSLLSRYCTSLTYSLESSDLYAHAQTNILPLQWTRADKPAHHSI